MQNFEDTLRKFVTAKENLQKAQDQLNQAEKDFQEKIEGIKLQKGQTNSQFVDSLMKIKDRKEQAKTMVERFEKHVEESQAALIDFFFEGIESVSASFDGRYFKVKLIDGKIVTDKF